MLWWDQFDHDGAHCAVVLSRPQNHVAVLPEV